MDSLIEFVVVVVVVMASTLSNKNTDDDDDDDDDDDADCRYGNVGDNKRNISRNKLDNVAGLIRFLVCNGLE